MREKINSTECETPDTAAHRVPDTANTSTILTGQKPDTTPEVVLEEKPSPMLVVQAPETDLSLMPENAKTSPILSVKTPDAVPRIIPEKAKTSPVLALQTTDVVPHIISRRPKTSPMLAVQTRDAVPRVLPEKSRTANILRARTPDAEKAKSSLVLVGRTLDAAPHVIPDKAKSSPALVVWTPDAARQLRPEKTASFTMQDDDPQTTGRGLACGNDNKVTEVLMQNHDLVLSTLRSRLTKLQVVRHFWERNDIKGAINALQRLPDHSLQADVISVLMEKMGSLTLDLFSSLLPVLLGLLDSKTERHTSISLEMLLKLVAVFGPVVHSTISAPPAVGVDLHAEKRLECCNQCFTHLQKIQKTLPTIIRRGGQLAKGAHELKLILQAS